jgi:hypothetical protein
MMEWSCCTISGEGDGDGDGRLRKGVENGIILLELEYAFMVI